MAQQPSIERAGEALQILKRNGAREFEDLAGEVRQGGPAAEAQPAEEPAVQPEQAAETAGEQEPAERQAAAGEAEGEWAEGEWAEGERSEEERPAG